MTKVVKAINFVKLLKGYNKPGWAGISEDHTKVLLWAKTLKELRKKADKMELKVIVFPTGEVYDNFIG